MTDSPIDNPGGPGTVSVPEYRYTEPSPSRPVRGGLLP
jgi:hypothetical protein